MQYDVEYNGGRHIVTRTWSCLFGFKCTLHSYRHKVHACFEADAASLSLRNSRAASVGLFERSSWRIEQ